ncbi:hypothetical protein [uncultured Rhodoblastus sp.]|uniref:hypothetical protein n=1 Tax=uncultured Rhodoblastus sp. TaxID=543037 RepID=UPI0025EB8A33|nr:hypothetical protein [uncultured Rhodoblastus sp.]
MTTDQTVVMIGIQALAVGLGFYGLVLLLRKARNPTIIAFHVLAGLGAIETLFGFLRMSELAADSPVRALGITAAKWLGAAVVTGALTPFVGKGRPLLANTLLLVHIGSALAGFIMTVLFARQA